MKKTILSIIFLILLLGIATALEFNGTVYKTDGTVLNGTNVSVITKDVNFGQVDTQSTLTNASGWFNLTLSDVANYRFQISMYHANESVPELVDYVGQSLPLFPAAQFALIGGNVPFYLLEAGTINITAVNSSEGARTAISYYLKDTAMGYPVATCTSSSPRTIQTICYVPKSRNYSLMVFPNSGTAETNFVPVSFEWNNFSSTQDYTIDTLSTYNATSRTVHKQFNVTEAYAKISGYFNGTLVSINDSFGSVWDDIKVVPYILEPGGNMLHPSAGTLPFNTSAWDGQQSDFYNTTNGYFNITLPYVADETVTYMLYAAGRNGTNYYGAFRNITVTGNQELNFTMRGLLGSRDNISMSDSMGGAEVNVTTKKKIFNIVNATTNVTLTNFNAHMEMTVDYSDYEAIEFTLMFDTGGSGGGVDATYSFPMLNVTGFKEINVYPMGSEAPKRLGSKTAAQIISNPNISISSFQPRTFGGDTGATIGIATYRSNSSCNYPGNEIGCRLESSTGATFNFLKTLVSGGKINMRVGIGDVFVDFINVDMFASGSPDALFDNNDDVTELTSGGFSKAMKFGSGGPKIYDYALLSMPYTEGSSNVAALNESLSVNISIPKLYDEDYSTVIWDKSINGTDGTALGANISHYNTNAAEWTTLLGNVTCSTAGANLTYFNATNPCYIDTSNNRIWIRIPHFSATQSEITAAVTTVASSSTSSSSSSSSSSAGGSSAEYDAGELSESYEKTLSKNDKIVFTIDGVDFKIRLDEVESESIEIYSFEDEETTSINEGFKKKFDLDGDGNFDVFITCKEISDGSATLIVELYGETTDEYEEQVDSDEGVEEDGEEGIVTTTTESGYKLWWVWIIVGVVIVGGVIGLVLLRKKK